MTVRKMPNEEMFTTIDTEKYGTTSEEVVAQLREMIHRGDLRPGDRLPPERDLAKQLGVSRPKVVMQKGENVPGSTPSRYSVQAADAWVHRGQGLRSLSVPDEKSQPELTGEPSSQATDRLRFALTRETHSSTARGLSSWIKKPAPCSGVRKFWLPRPACGVSGCHARE